MIISMMNQKPEYYNDLEKTLNFIRNECEVAIYDRKHELHQLYLATQGTNFPEVRTVIFRNQDLLSGKIIFHTDKRSNKIKEILSNPKASLMGYNHQNKYQIRFRGTVQLHINNEISKSSWQKVGVSSRRCYLTQNAPGSLFENPTSGLSEDLESKAPNFEQSEIGFDNFVVCHFMIQEIEWLYLNAHGHRRALFQFRPDLSMKSTWLQP